MNRSMWLALVGLVVIFAVTADGLSINKITKSKNLAQVGISCSSDSQCQGKGGCNLNINECDMLADGEPCKLKSDCLGNNCVATPVTSENKQTSLNQQRCGGLLFGHICKGNSYCLTKVCSTGNTGETGTCSKGGAGALCHGNNDCTSNNCVARTGSDRFSFIKYCQ